MISRLVLDRERMPARAQFVAMQRKRLRRVVENLVPTGLCLEQDRERAIAADIDPLDRVHLTGDAQGHGAPV